MLINIVLLLLFCCSACNGLTISVTDSLTVIRGSQAMITALYSIDYNVTGGVIQCSIVAVERGDYCGYIYPSTIDCISTNTTQVFQHYGCLNPYEMINFQAIIQTDDNKVYSESFSIAVHILPNNNPLVQLITQPYDINPYQSTLSFVFPSSFICDQCSYTVIANTTNYSIPLLWNDDGAIVINGPLYQPIPCGYSPKIPFLFYPPNTTHYHHKANDTIVLVRTTCRTNMADTTSYQIVPLFIETLAATELHKLPTAYLHISELSESIVPPTTLLLSSSLQTMSLYKVVKFVFPIKDTGGLYPMGSYNKGSLIATTFTSAQLRLDRVIFKPNQSSIASYLSTSTMFHYYVLNCAGSPIGKGTLHVRLSPRIGQGPSVRKNTGITINKGQSQFLTSNNLDLYPPLFCFNYTVTVVTVPSRGYISGGVNTKPYQINDRFSVSAKNLNIVYHYNLTNNNNIIQLDSTVWSIQCTGIPDYIINVSIPFTIININRLSTPTHCLISVLTYVGVATPLYVHVNESCRLWGKVTMETHPRLGALITNKCIVNDTYYPSYTTLDSSCYTNDTNISEWNDLWYISPITNGTDVIRLVSLNDSQYVALHIQILPYSNKVSIVKNHDPYIMGNLSHSELPYIQTNIPLPLLSPTTSVYITEQYLYVHALSYLLNDIVYTISSHPKHGLICVLHDKDCHNSVDTFTQEDILARHVYYKPHFNSTSDQFKFRVFYLNGLNSIPGLHTFYMIPFTERSPIPLKQFWLSSKSEKPLARKHLRHFQRYFKTKKLTFTLLTPPRYGILRRNVFTWDDIGRRIVTYRHMVHGTCADQVTLNVTTQDGRHITSNFSIAIKNSTNNRVLNVASKGHTVDGDKNFILSQNDFVYESNFCFEFLTFTVTSIPSYGLLRYHDDHSGLSIQLDQNATFSGRDIIESRLTYQIFPDLVFFHETQDTFELSPQDPQGPSKRESRSIPTSLFLVYINPDSVEMTLNLTIVSPKVITKLNTIHYGTIFDQTDMYLTDSDFIPANVFFLIRKSPLFGNIQRDLSPVEQFSLQDVHNGKISYISSLFHTDTNITSDEFEFSVFVKIEKTSHLYTRSVKFVVRWCYFAITSGINQIVRVDEMTTKLPLIVSIIGADITVPANVSLVTVEEEGNETATEGNCTTSSSSLLLPTNGDTDYCAVNTRVLFEPSHTTKGIVHVQILDDSIAEGLELFVVELRDPQTCFIPVHSEINVFIVDYADYPFIKFSKNINQEEKGYHLSEQNHCPIQYTVQETTHSINITLTRTGNLNQSNSVICYTKSPSPQSNNDYIHRPNNMKSLVTFDPWQVHAHCTVNIINDGLNEPSEYFFAYLGEVVDGYAFIDHSSSPVCVFIEHDREDVPFVSFRTTQLLVKERRDSIVPAYFTVLRNGTDLSRETNLLCQVIPNRGNATGGMDYSLSFVNKIKFTESGQTLAIGHIDILPDMIEEGNEVFYLLLKTPYNGRIADKGQVMEIVIIDATETMTIGFSQPNFTISETAFFFQIPLYRHGDLTPATNVTCTLTPGTADITDYYVSRPQTVIFSSNSSNETCNIIVYDDVIREGEETVMVTIVTSDPYVKIANGGQTVVIIRDPEDAPIVQFKQSMVYTSEPLSNNLIDYKAVTIPIQRTLGPNVNASVLYSTVDTTGCLKCYVPTKGKVYFPIGNYSQFIAIQVLVNHTSHRNEVFYVQLSIDYSSDTLIGERNVTKVIVRNTPLNGVYFPTNPRIMSLLNEEGAVLSWNGSLYYDLPLACITSCDRGYTNDHLTRELPSTQCNEQGIDVSNTRYKWETSQDGTNFKQLQLDTLFSSTTVNILESFYLSPNTWIRCTAVPVDTRGLRGYPRTSQPVFISNNTFNSYIYNSSTVSSHFTTYSGFQRSEKDMVKLTVIVPAIPNAIPILTTKPLHFPLVSLLTHPLARGSHPCSTLTLPGERVSFITREPCYATDSTLSRSLSLNLFYKHLKGTKWTFKIWLPIKDLVQKCGANLSNNNLNLSMPLYVSLATYVDGKIVLVNHSKHTVVLAKQSPSTSSLISLPFIYYPLNISTQLYFTPLTIELLRGDTLRVVGHTYTTNDTNIINVRLTHGNESQFIFPVYFEFDNNSNGRIYGWIFEVLNVSLLESKVLFQIDVCRNFNVALKTCNHHSFLLPFRLVNNYKRMEMSYKLATSLERASEVRRNTVNMTGDHILQLSLSLHPSFIALRPGYMLNVTAINLCSATIVDTPYCNQSMEGNNSVIIQRENHSSLIVYLKLDSLMDTLLVSTLQWSIQIHSNIISVNNKLHTTAVSSQTTLTSIPPYLILYNSTNPPTTILSTNTTVLVPTVNTLPIYAFILILLTVAVLVSVCSVTGVLLVYVLRQKWILKRKDKLLTTDEIVKKNKGFESVAVVTTGTLRRPTARPVHVITRRSRHHSRRYSNSSSSSSSSSPLSRDSTASSNDSNKDSNGHTSLRRSRSLPTIPSSRELTPSDIECNSGVIMNTTNTTFKTNHLISELQLLPKKERTNVLIATVKPLHHSSSPTNAARPSNVIVEDYKAEKTPSSSCSSDGLPLDVVAIKKRLSSSYVPQGVGWYERYKGRQKALAMYSQLYLTNTHNATTVTNESEIPQNNSTTTPTVRC